MDKKYFRIVFIGSGNLATNLSKALHRSGHTIAQVYSRTLAHAQCLAEKLRCQATNQIAEIVTDADIYIFSVKDDALPGLIESLSSRLSPRSSRLFLHTAGSVPMSVFRDSLSTKDGQWEFGVLYPMQTFSKAREVDFHEIPVFIEADSATALAKVETLAGSISNKVVLCDSEQRKYLHLAAVFACNLTNHCYRLCEQVLEDANQMVNGTSVNGNCFDFKLFLPLINETARKVAVMSPREAQTGPMVRYDKTIMQKQLDLINRPLAKDIYSIMAKSIHEDSLE